MFGLTSLDGLIAILLIETGWWGKEFLETKFPQLMSIGLVRLFFNVYVLGFFLLFLLKFLIQGLLWFVFLRNYTGRSPLIKIWYWMGIGLDVVNVFYIISWSSGGQTPPSTLLIQFAQIIVFRGSIWALATLFIRNISSDENILFPSGFVAYILDLTRIEVMIVVVMIWETVWYFLIALTTYILVYSEYHGEILSISRAYWIHPFIFHITVAAVIVSVFQCVGVVQKWKPFLKLCIPVYIIVNIFGYALISFLDIWENGNHYVSLAYLTAQLILPVFPLALKIGAVTGLFVFLGKSDTEKQKAKFDEVQPLVTCQK